VAESEQIKRMLLVTDTWSVSTGEFTPTMKLKRKILLSKYLPLFNQSITIN
jgi:long-chain acyl-CoA synthetase